MKNRKITSLMSMLLLLVYSCTGQAQRKIPHTEDLKELLIDFLISKNEASKHDEKSILFLTDLSFNDGRNLFKEDTDMIDLKVGIYSFGLLGPHFNNYLMFVSSEITLIENYKTENVLSNLSDFLRYNSTNFSEDQKIQIAINVLKVLNIRKLNEELDKEILNIDLDE